MKLYKQKLIDGKSVSEPTLVVESDSFEVLRKEAELPTAGLNVVQPKN